MLPSKSTRGVLPGMPMPGAISSAFEVSTCNNQPAPDLRESDFTVLEDGIAIDGSESSRTILDRRAAAFITIVLDNSPSVAAAGAVNAVADSALAYVYTALNDTEQVYISIASFSRRFTVLTDYSDDFEMMRQAIESYRQDGSGNNTTNLYGSYIEALNASLTAQRRYRDRNLNGLVTIGDVLFLTDGNDNADVKGLEDARTALKTTTDDVLVVSLGSVDQNAIDALSSTTGILAETDGLATVFRERITRTLVRQRSVYVLGYCSPKLSGDHDVSISIDGSRETPLLRFNADGWLDYNGPECSRIGFTSGCAGRTCGGLWCGSCGPPNDDNQCTQQFRCLREPVQCQPTCVEGESRCAGTNQIQTCTESRRV